jgi:uncharacterized membrane protein YeaQ/YmgE (transglycosylase-associated protein family)
MMDSAVVSWLINLLSGAVGGNIAGALMKSKSLGTLWNSVVGILGGAGGATLLSALGLGGGGVLGSIAGSGVGGAILMIICGLFKKANTTTA